MNLTRREPPEIGISFLDTITCGVGAIILLMTVTTTRPQEAPPSDSDPRAMQISQLQRQLFAAQAELGKVTSEAASKVSTAALSESELKKVKAQIAALLAALFDDSPQREAAVQAALHAGRRWKVAAE